MVVDVGIHRTSKGICGDLDLESVKERLRAYTPVPRGVGPMTVCSLLENTAQAGVSYICVCGRVFKSRNNEVAMGRPSSRC